MMELGGKNRNTKHSWMSIASLAIFAFALLVNIFSKELFGIVEGYAPHNFAFNIGVLLPLHTMGLILSIIVYCRWIKDRCTLLDLLLALPSLIVGFVALGTIFCLSILF